MKLTSYLRIVQFLLLGLLWGCAYAQVGRAGDFPRVDYTAQAGVDAWSLAPKAPGRYFLMPNNSTWRYRPVSVWGTFDGQMGINKNLSLTVRARADQYMGTHVDEAAAAWGFSPSLGVKAGLVSYKTSWCRTYDMDSPWVRENDPFCTTPSTSMAVGGAPGLQLYANSAIGPYRLQALVGVYRPLLFNYNTTEFSNTGYTPSKLHIDVNDKTGASLSVLHEPSSTQARVGVLETKQSALYSNDVIVDPATLEIYKGFNRINQSNSAVFVGVSFYLAPTLNVRAQTLRHQNVSGQWAAASGGAIYDSGIEMLRRSDVMEFNYQYNPQNLWGLALSKYQFDYTDIYSNYPNPGFGRTPREFQLTGVSASWRHDWDKGVFTVVQLTRNNLHLQNWGVENPKLYETLHVEGLGVRLGYQF